MVKKPSIMTYRTNYKSSGFTLIELLVVISIIALLLSILMPSLQKVKQQARRVVCMSNLKQWGVVFGMYANDNNDSLTRGHVGTNGPEYQWMEATRPYYENAELRVCPSTRQPLADATGSATGGTLGDPHFMWGIWNIDEYWFTKGDYGSYGINFWACNPPSDVANFWIFKFENNWRKTSVSGGSNIPLFLDSWWPGGWPDTLKGESDMGILPPEFEGDCGVSGEEMKRFAIDRHDGGTTNSLFLDFSVKKLKTKELWKLKWHRNFDTNNIYTQPDAPWPEWMSKF